MDLCDFDPLPALFLRHSDLRSRSRNRQLPFFIPAQVDDLDLQHLSLRRLCIDAQAGRLLILQILFHSPLQCGNHLFFKPRMHLAPADIQRTGMNNRKTCRKIILIRSYGTRQVLFLTVPQIVVNLPA